MSGAAPASWLFLTASRATVELARTAFLARSLPLMPDESSSILQARRHIHALCAGGRPDEALRYAEQVEGHPFETEQLLAITELDAGERLADREIIARGLARFEQLEGDSEGEPFAYNRANGRLAMWQVAVVRLGIAQALAQHREDLQQARDLFSHVGADLTEEDNDRCQALTNLGNSLDACGRHIDALRAYNDALRIRACFGMAHGNRGLTLLYRAAVDENHQHALVCEAVRSLDAALSDPDEILTYGGTAALESFRSKRALIDGTPTHEHDESPFSDPYLEWCRRRELFMHLSHPCITSGTKVLDALRFGGMTVGIDQASQRRLRTMQDALNSLLQDYIAIRYLTWIAIEPDTATRRHAAELSQHASFYDSLTYARWGIATGLSVNALAAATNLLDKAASVTHLYLRTGRTPSQIYFRRFWLLPRNRNTLHRPDPVIAKELDAGNLGLLALCDLAGELERPTPLNELVARRHAATHRTVAVHHMLVEDIDDEGWLDRITADDLREALLAQLTRARAALVYLVDLIKHREERCKPGGPIVTLPAWLAEPERADDR